MSWVQSLALFFLGGNLQYSGAMTHYEPLMQRRYHSDGTVTAVPISLDLSDMSITWTKGSETDVSREVAQKGGTFAAVALFSQSELDAQGLARITTDGRGLYHVYTQAPRWTAMLETERQAVKRRVDAALPRYTAVQYRGDQ